MKSRSAVCHSQTGRIYVQKQAYNALHKHCVPAVSPKRSIFAWLKEPKTTLEIRYEGILLGGAILFHNISPSSKVLLSRRKMINAASLTQYNSL